MDTKKCLVCLDVATWFTGHVHDGRQIITAGWCQIHYAATTQIGNRVKGCHMQKGCCGKYTKRYGKNNT